MSFALVLLVVAGVTSPEPLTVEVVRSHTTVDISFELTQPLPDELASALASGAEARLSYTLKIKARRKAWWDRRVWSGQLVAIAAFDPITGRYRCSVVLDGVITSTGEGESAEAARQWLRAPPPVRVELPEARRDAELRIRVRAVFSTGTTWLVFPTQNATPWVEVVPPPPAADTDQ